MTIEMTENLITKNVLQLENIQESANYTCQAQSTLGLVTKDVAVKVQGKESVSVGTTGQLFVVPTSNERNRCT